jgi:hypothetical protein
VNFFQRFRARPAEEIQPAAMADSPSSKEATTKPTDTVKPIQVNDSQFVQLTRALRPKVARVLKDLQIDVPGSNVPAVVGGAAKPPPTDPPISERELRGPIV